MKFLRIITLYTFIIFKFFNLNINASPSSSLTSDDLIFAPLSSGIHITVPKKVITDCLVGSLEKFFISRNGKIYEFNTTAHVGKLTNSNNEIIDLNNQSFEDASQILDLAKLVLHISPHMAHIFIHFENISFKDDTINGYLIVMGKNSSLENFIGLNSTLR